MTLTRKQAILALLCAQAAYTQIDGPPMVVDDDGFVHPEVSTTDNTIAAWRNTGSIAIDLADRSPLPSPTYIGWRGIDSIVVSYHGETRTITAKEIWEALVD